MYNISVSNHFRCINIVITYQIKEKYLYGCRKSKKKKCSVIICISIFDIKFFRNVCYKFDCSWYSVFSKLDKGIERSGILKLNLKMKTKGKKLFNFIRGIHFSTLYRKIGKWEMACWVLGHVLQSNDVVYIALKWWSYKFPFIPSSSRYFKL